VVGAAEGAQGGARHILHHHIGRGRVRYRIKNLDHIGVLQPPHQGRFGREKAGIHRAVNRVTQGRSPHELDGHIAVMEVISAKKHLAGGAFAQLLDDPVLADHPCIEVNVNAVHACPLI